VNSATKVCFGQKAKHGHLRQTLSKGRSMEVRNPNALKQRFDKFKTRDSPGTGQTNYIVLRTML